MFEDGEDTEFEKPELEEEEPEPDTVTFTVSHKNLMTKMYRMYPDSFNLSNGVKLTLAHEHYNFNASTPKLIIDPSLTPGSFLDTPVWAGEADNSTGVWPFQTRFPRGAHPYRAGYTLRPPGRPIDIFIKDKVLRDFLLAPKISSASLDSVVYHENQSFPLTGDHKVNTDHFLRQGLLEAFYADKLINIGMETMKNMSAELDIILQGHPMAGEAVSFITDLFGLISFSNMRYIHNSTAAIIANKTALRQQIMNKLIVPPKTAQMLKNSSFICKGLFGDLPQSFLDKCYGWQGQHYVAKDKRKFNNNYSNFNTAGSSGRGRGQKRQGSASNPRAKRGKFNNNISNYTPDESSVFPRSGSSNPNWKSRGRGRGKN